jgi:clan AA aspartic protease
MDTKTNTLATFSVPVHLSGPSGADDIEALVDTGATYSVLPRSVLDRLGVSPKDRMAFSLADERIVEYDLGEVSIELGDKERTVLVVFGPDQAQPLLGATTSELFGLGVDPVAQRLIPVMGLLK